jgi:hypothetical protein
MLKRKLELKAPVSKKPRATPAATLALEFVRDGDEAAKLLHTVVSLPSANRSVVVAPVNVAGVPQARLIDILDAGARMLDMNGGAAQLLKRFVVNGANTRELDADVSFRPGGNDSNNPKYRGGNTLSLYDPDVCDLCGALLDMTGNASKRCLGAPKPTAAALRVCGAITSECPRKFPMVLAGEHYECEKVPNTHGIRFSPGAR